MVLIIKGHCFARQKVMYSCKFYLINMTEINYLYTHFTFNWLNFHFSFSTLPSFVQQKRIFNQTKSRKTGLILTANIIFQRNSSKSGCTMRVSARFILVVPRKMKENLVQYTTRSVHSLYVVRWWMNHQWKRLYRSFFVCGSNKDLIAGTVVVVLNVMNTTSRILSTGDGVKKSQLKSKYRDKDA